MINPDTSVAGCGLLYVDFSVKVQVDSVNECCVQIPIRLFIMVSRTLCVDSWKYKESSSPTGFF